MTALELYRFIQENKIEYRLQKNNEGEDDVLCWFNFMELSEFTELLKLDIEYEIMGNIQRYHVAVFMKDICFNNGFDFTEVFK